MKRWLREPLLHFLAGGAILFGVHAWLNPGPADSDTASRQIRIGAGEVRWLAETWERQWRRPPTQEELNGLVANLLKEELLAREAKELRLDESDTIVRRRLAQKLEFMIQDTARLAEPTEEELLRLYEAAADAYLTEPRISFAQVYFNPERRKDAAKDARDALAKLARSPSLDHAGLGDRLLAGTEFRDVGRQAVASALGPDFARAVFALPAGSWQGPLESGYGVHLVRIASIAPVQRRPFPEVKGQVLERWREQKQHESEARFYERLREKYQVVIDADVRAAVGPLTLVPPAQAAR